MPRRTLDTHAVRKEYPGTVALRDVTVEFDGGRVHAIIGKNGAGKSTLVKILSGAVQPTSGTLLLNGKPVELRSPKDALDAGIVAVYQELSLVPDLTVAENILLGRLPKKRALRGIIVDWAKAYARAEELLANLHITLDVRSKANSLGVAQQQVVEITRAMSYKPSVLMLDEPTSALSYTETELLFSLLRTLAAQGVVVLYITHRLQELHRIADTVTVLRDGDLVGTIGIAEATPGRIVQMMFGETVQSARPRDLPSSREPVMQVRNISRGNSVVNVSFTLYRGEILGIAGLLGSGRTELLRTLFGADPPDEGEVVVNGKAVHPQSPLQMKRLGIAFAPEKRKEEGLVQILNTRMNICMASLARISNRGFTTRSREQKIVEGSVRDVGITVADVEAPVSSLSGGNQQKVVLGKWLSTEPFVMLLDEPTRGIDLQSKQHVFQILWDLSKRGISSLVVSTELEELIDVCHRILIMKKGRIVGEALPRETSLEKLFALCLE